MLSQGLVFAFCTTLLVFTAADDKTDLINAITDLQKQMKAVTDEIASFENQKSNELNQVKGNYTSSVEKAEKSKNQLKDFKNDFCDNKLKDLTEYDYEAEITSGLKDETDIYTKSVTPISELFGKSSKQLDDLKGKVENCGNPDPGCISTQNSTYEMINKAVDLPKNKDVVEKEIAKFKNIVSDVTKRVIGTIQNKETDTESCFIELSKAKNEIDNFSVTVDNNISKATAEIKNHQDKAEDVINQVNKNLTDSFSSVIKKTTSQVQAHEDEATKKNVNIEACNANTLDGTLEQLKKEFLDLFNAGDVKSYQDEVNALINSTITTVEGYSSVSKDLESQLKACNSIECIQKTKQSVDDKSNQISQDINASLKTISNKISEYQSDIDTSEKLIESSFSSQVESKAQFVLQCVILKVNAADIKTIQSTILSATSALGDAITQLNTKALSTKNSWQQKQQEYLQDLDEYLYDILSNVTSHEKNAFTHSIRIDNCFKNKTQLHDVFITGASKEITAKIDTHYSEIEKVLEDNTNKLNNYYIHDISDLVEVLRQCQQSDTDCISKAKKETDEKLEEIKNSEEDAKNKLDELVVSSSKAIENDFQVIENDTKVDASKTADEIIKCIKDSIDNSAISFAPTSLVMVIALFVQLCHSYL